MTKNNTHYIIIYMNNFVLGKSLRNKRGFTLIELLVVIAILGILATIAGLSISFFVKESKKKSQYTTMETSIKTCNAIFLEINLGYSGMDISDLSEFQSMIGPMVKEVNYIEEHNVDTTDISIDNDEMYIYYNYDNTYEGSEGEFKYYLNCIIYKVDGSVWIYKYNTGKITLNGNNYN